MQTSIWLFGGSQGRYCQIECEASILVIMQMALSYICSTEHVFGSYIYKTYRLNTSNQYSSADKHPQQHHHHHHQHEDYLVLGQPGSLHCNIANYCKESSPSSGFYNKTTSTTRKTDS